MKLNVDVNEDLHKRMFLCVLGMQEVTEDNFDEFFIRSCMYHRAFKLEDGMLYPTPGMAWRAFIGVKNPRVQPEEIGEWWHRMGENLSYDLLHKHSMDYEYSWFSEDWDAHEAACGKDGDE